MTLQEIETHTRSYAAARSALAIELDGLNREIDLLKRKALPRIHAQAARAATLKADLIEEIESSPELFEKKRTLIVDGIKVGIVKQRGRVEFSDEEAVIRRIRELLPRDQVELLIRVRESLHKPAVYDLMPRDMARLGIRLTADEDQVIVKALDGDVDKIVDAMLADVGDLEERVA